MAKKGGDLCREPVFDTFYRKHSEALYSFMYYRCGNKDNALDLVQEAFLKVYGKIEIQESDLAPVLDFCLQDKKNEGKEHIGFLTETNKKDQ